ncbi:hypothetical protein HanPSC8_Chr02g0049751 [Helianthus annuus]|nr:hypothetical protein HanPSC8_Chr02g0049751 [Helianthus annuus]
MTFLPFIQRQVLTGVKFLDGTGMFQECQGQGRKWQLMRDSCFDHIRIHTHTL